MVTKKIIMLISFINIPILMSCQSTDDVADGFSDIPTANHWPPGTMAGSRTMVRNISPHPHAFALVTAPHPVRYGMYSERFELRHGDCGGSDCSNPRARSEIRDTVDGTGVIPDLNQDTWVGWSFYNESILDTFPSLNPVVGQWKVNSNEALIKFFQQPAALASFEYCEPEFCYTQDPGSYDVVVQLDDLHIQYDLEGPQNWGQPCALFDMSEVRGEWIDIVINTNFGTDDEGYLRVWINDELRCSYFGQIVATNEIEYDGPSHRHGIYWGSTAAWDATRPNDIMPTMVAYYDEYRVGTSREQVDIRLIEAAGGPPVD